MHVCINLVHMDKKDFTSGTGGFLTSALNHMAPQVKSAADNELLQRAVVGQEWKPLPYLLSITNLLLHDIESPNIRKYHERRNSLDAKIDETLGKIQQLLGIEISKPR